MEYAQARYYNPSHGRFTSVDPLTASASIRDPQTFNRYSYALNSPYKFSDPLGLLPEGRRSGDGSCGAEYSSCSDDWGASTYAAEPPEATPTDEGVADNQQTASASDSQQEAVEPEPPPKYDLQVNDISIFAGTFPPNKEQADGGKKAVNPNGTSEVSPFGFALSVDYTLTKNGKPVSGAKIVEEIKVEVTQIVSENGKIITDTLSSKTSGNVSNKPTSKAGKFTDEPLGARSDTPYTSIKITQTLYAVTGKNGARQELITNTISATFDYKITNNQARGSGKGELIFSNSNFTKTLTLSRPTKIQN